MIVDIGGGELVDLGYIAGVDSEKKFYEEYKNIKRLELDHTLTGFIRSNNTEPWKMTISEKDFYLFGGRRGTHEENEAMRKLWESEEPLREHLWKNDRNEFRRRFGWWSFED